MNVTEYWKLGGRILSLLKERLDHISLNILLRIIWHTALEGIQEAQEPVRCLLLTV